jgi:hypothetical protein
MNGTLSIPEQGKTHFKEAKDIISRLNHQIILLLKKAITETVGDCDESVIQEMAQQYIQNEVYNRSFILHCRLCVEREIKPNYSDNAALQKALEMLDKKIALSGADDIAQSLCELEQEKENIESTIEKSKALPHVEKENAELLCGLMQSQYLLDAKKSKVLADIHQNNFGIKSCTLNQSVQVNAPVINNSNNINETEHLKT